MPEDAAARFSDGTAWISLTQILPRPANKLYAAFDSRAALIKALLISTHLPRLVALGGLQAVALLARGCEARACLNPCCVCALHRLSDGSLLTGSHKGMHKRCFDGGFSNLCPVPPVLEAVHAAAAATGADGTSSGAMVQRVGSTRGISTPLTLSMQPNSLSSHSTAAASHQHSSSHSSSSGAAQHHHAHAQGSRGLTMLGLARRPGPSAEEALAASCLVEGAGSYLAAPGWFVVRVCVLPAAHLHELPQMFKARLCGLTRGEGGLSPTQRARSSFSDAE
jgi:hypothetical protein